MTKINASIAPCRPVDLDLNDPLDADIAARTIIYTDSVEATCANLLCRRKIWIGPRVKAAIDAELVNFALCFRCGIAWARQNDISPDEVISLDNPEGDNHAGT